MQTFYAVIPYSFSPPIAHLHCQVAVFNLQQFARTIIKRRLWGICWHCWHSAFLLMKTWQTDRQGLAKCLRVAETASFSQAQFPLLTLATFINVIGHRQILGALAGLLLGITNGPGKTALQGILALVAELLLSSTGIICKERDRESGSEGERRM